MIYIYVIAVPIGIAMTWLVSTLKDLQGGSAILLGVIIGAMTAIDMGGPINKTATAFTLALMAEGVYAQWCSPYCCGDSTASYGTIYFYCRKKYTAEDKDLGMSAFFMGLIGITEGAIPFAVKDVKTCVTSNYCW